MVTRPTGPGEKKRTDNAINVGYGPVAPSDGAIPDGQCRTTRRGNVDARR